jgi:PHD/YefM family antitoxin component YafN of YafNO toxin-antitoxin module
VATALRETNERSAEPQVGIEELVARLGAGPVTVESGGRAVAVLVDLDRYQDMQAIYEWHQQVLQERRAS